jgi:hypothetical protein
MHDRHTDLGLEKVEQVLLVHHPVPDAIAPPSPQSVRSE